MTRKKAQPPHYHRPALILIGLLIGSAAVLMTQAAKAGPITNPGAAPLTKIGVYQGIISIIDGTDVLEIGNAGRDIASTGIIYLRPGSLIPDQPFATNVVYTYDVGGKAYLNVGLGRICLGNTGNCRSTWSSGGGADPNWQTAGTPTYLEPINSNNGIEIGTLASPIPAGNGMAGVIYANYAGAAVRLGADLVTGYDIGGSIYSGGSIDVNGDIESRHVNFRAYQGTVQPWNQIEDDITGGIGLDADTFDGDTVLPFPKDTHGGSSYHDLFWKTVSSGAVSVDYICLHTNADQLCTGGTNPGTPCPLGTECTGGGTCTVMCSEIQRTCPADPNPFPPVGDPGVCWEGQYCQGGARNGLKCYRNVDESDPNACPGGACVANPALNTDLGGGVFGCYNNAHCGVTDRCIWGTFEAFGYALDSSCGGRTCAEDCPFVTKQSCTGGTPSYAQCGGWGTNTDYDQGLSAGGCAWNGTAWRLLCDCRLTTDTPYLSVNAPLSGLGADICTSQFQS